jgi:hypothetical protein
MAAAYRGKIANTKASQLNAGRPLGVNMSSQLTRSHQA